MTVGEIISNVEKQRPGCNLVRYDFIDEINRIETEIYENILSCHEGEHICYTVTLDSDTVSVPEMFCELYIYRILAKIDLHNGDIKRYTNNMLLYNNLMSSFTDWYNRGNMPKQRSKMRWF
ncbi:MAG: hypothetical protein E7591_01165 [Ruminococcaceae bacterium]|nr:hypothetical protein [Oscillospiraceae bacterium]